MIFNSIEELKKGLENEGFTKDFDTKEALKECSEKFPYHSKSSVYTKDLCPFVYVVESEKELDIENDINNSYRIDENVEPFIKIYGRYQDIVLDYPLFRIGEEELKYFDFDRLDSATTLDVTARKDMTCEKDYETITWMKKDETKHFSMCNEDIIKAILNKICHDTSDESYDLVSFDLDDTSDYNIMEIIKNFPSRTDDGYFHDFFRYNFNNYYLDLEEVVFDEESVKKLEAWVDESAQECLKLSKDSESSILAEAQKIKKQIRATLFTPEIQMQKPIFNKRAAISGCFADQAPDGEELQGEKYEVSVYDTEAYNKNGERLYWMDTRDTYEDESDEQYHYTFAAKNLKEVEKEFNEIIINAQKDHFGFSLPDCRLRNICMTLSNFQYLFKEDLLYIKVNYPELTKEDWKKRKSTNPTTIEIVDNDENVLRTDTFDSPIAAYLYAKRALPQCNPQRGQILASVQALNDLAYNQALTANHLFLSADYAGSGIMFRDIINWFEKEKNKWDVPRNYKKNILPNFVDAIKDSLQIMMANRKGSEAETIKEFYNNAKKVCTHRPDRFSDEAKEAVEAIKDFCNKEKAKILQKEKIQEKPTKVLLCSDAYGFCLSEKAKALYRSLSGYEGEIANYLYPINSFNRDEILKLVGEETNAFLVTRDDPLLIKVVEELGKDAFRYDNKYTIANVPESGYYILSNFAEKEVLVAANTLCKNQGKLIPKRSKESKHMSQGVDK